MAILTSAELTENRQECERARAIAINYTKPQINAALQAVEDWFESNRASAGAAIEAAAPGVFTNAQKKEIGRVFFLQKALNRGG